MSSFEIDRCLRLLVEREGSDLHIKVNAPPMARIDGSLRPLDDEKPLTPKDTEAALKALLVNDRNREEFEEEGETDLSYELEGVSRFRVNAFRQRGAVSIVCRAIPFQVRTIEDLGLPPVMRSLADEQRGIILLTGTTGSGKSTTLAAMIDHINDKYPRHVITLEDPIEYLHRDKRSIINQREVGSDTHSFARAMRRVLRQDPDVILVGEMRDEETVRTALSAAETGHLVLSTLHTLDATETINRIIDFFPPHLQQQARVMLAATLRGAVSQRLVPTSDGKGRVAAAEVLVVTGRVQDLILNPNETGKISQVIGEGEYYGMQTFDQALLDHVTAGRVDETTAMEYASSPHDFKLMLASAGKRASDLSQLLDEPDAGAGTDSDHERQENGTVDGPDDGPLLQTDLRPTPLGRAAVPAEGEDDSTSEPASEEDDEPEPEPADTLGASGEEPEEEEEPASEELTEAQEEAGEQEEQPVQEPVAASAEAEPPQAEYAFERKAAPARPAPEAAPSAEPEDLGLGDDEYAHIWSSAIDQAPDSADESSESPDRSAEPPERPADRPPDRSVKRPPPGPPAGEFDRLAEYRPRKG